MTDYPRFQIAHRAPDQDFREYYGAALVELVLLVVDSRLIADLSGRVAGQLRPRRLGVKIYRDGAVRPRQMYPQ